MYLRYVIKKNVEPVFSGAVFETEVKTLLWKNLSINTLKYDGYKINKIQTIQQINVFQ